MAKPWAVGKDHELTDTLYLVSRLMLAIVERASPVTGMPTCMACPP
ncbi:hypothetical protein [Celerinatantimonas yamalensis]|uniref:Uncharacterized protein n=1 Tax=Celerinatantimonas yamalensis TaxID=559956 RepID=A0ABW9G6V3_9GAMM